MSLPTKLHPEPAPCPVTRTIDCSPSTLQGALDNAKSGDRLLCAGDFTGRTYKLIDRTFSPPISIEAKPGAQAKFHNSQSGSGAQCTLWINNTDGFHLVGLDISDGGAPDYSPAAPWDGAKLDGVRNARIFRCYVHDCGQQGIINRYPCDLVLYDSCHFSGIGQAHNSAWSEWKNNEGKHSIYAGWSVAPFSTRISIVNSLIEKMDRGGGSQSYGSQFIYAYNTVRDLYMRAIGDEAACGFNPWGPEDTDNAATSNLFINLINGTQASPWQTNRVILTAWKNAGYRVDRITREYYGNYKTVNYLGGDVWLQDGWTLADLAGKGDLAFQPKLDYAGQIRSGGTIGHLQAGGVTPPPPPPPPLPDDFFVVTNLKNGDVLRGKIPWNAMITNGAPDDVEFYIDNILRHTEHSAPYDFNGTPNGVLDPSTLPEGPHQFSVMAKDSAGRRGSVAFSAVVDVIPDVVNLPLTVPASTNKKTSFVAKWTPPAGVASYRFYGTSISVGGSALQKQVKFGKFPDGQNHTYRVEARNPAGQVIAVGTTVQKSG